MLKSRTVWNASVAIAILVRSAADLIAVEETLERAEDEDGKYGGTLRWCAYMTPRMSRAEQLSSEGRVHWDKSKPLWKYP
eukprot:COSAG05_NODE_14937_length_383_cov_0.542254_1_plen_79_part_01